MFPRHSTPIRTGPTSEGSSCKLHYLRLAPGGGAGFARSPNRSWKGKQKKLMRASCLPCAPPQIHGIGSLRSGLRKGARSHRFREGGGFDSPRSEMVSHEAHVYSASFFQWPFYDSGRGGSVPGSTLARLHARSVGVAELRFTLSDLDQKSCPPEQGYLGVHWPIDVLGVGRWGPCIAG